jgi:hypothetical protein
LPAIDREQALRTQVLADHTNALLDDAVDVERHLVRIDMQATDEKNSVAIEDWEASVRMRSSERDGIRMASLPDHIAQ